MLSHIVSFSQDIIGQWNGLLNTQGSTLRIAFNISKSQGRYNSTIDSPDQGATGIPTDSTSFENLTLTIEINNPKIHFEGMWIFGDSIVGIFNQNGQNLPLTLSKSEFEKKTRMKRIQEPALPYPYYTENVKFSNAKAGIELAGTLTLPEQTGVYPAVILITGSGPQDRDETMMGHKPFLVLSNHLTKNGIATLRYDDRGVAESTGNFKAATTIDFTTDVEAAISFLKTRPEINQDQIGLIGHSEGGLIAPIIASRTSAISFIVLLAAPGIVGTEAILLQKKLLGRVDGQSEKNLNQMDTINRETFEIAFSSKVNVDVANELTKYLTTQYVEHNIDIPGGMNPEEYAKAQTNLILSPWGNYFLQYDPTPALANVKCPVLALNGGKDLQVPSDPHLTIIGDILNENGNKNVTTKVIPQLNHLFQTCKTGSMGEYATIEETFSPLALEEISKWILNYLNP